MHRNHRFGSLCDILQESCEHANGYEGDFEVVRSLDGPFDVDADNLVILGLTSQDIIFYK